MRSHTHTSDSILGPAGERAKQYVDKGVEALDTAAERSRAITRQVDGYVRANPWWMIGAAAGLGLAVGMLIRRR